MRFVASSPALATLAVIASSTGCERVQLAPECDQVEVTFEGVVSVFPDETPLAGAEIRLVDPDGGSRTAVASSVGGYSVRSDVCVVALDGGTVGFQLTIGANGFLEVTDKRLVGAGRFTITRDVALFREGRLVLSLQPPDPMAAGSRVTSIDVIEPTQHIGLFRSPVVPFNQSVAVDSLPRPGVFTVRISGGLDFPWMGTTFYLAAAASSDTLDLRGESAWIGAELGALDLAALASDWALDGTLRGSLPIELTHLDSADVVHVSVGSYEVVGFDPAVGQVVRQVSVVAGDTLWIRIP